MSAYKIVYESNECILGFEPRGKDWIQYNCTLKIKDGGKKPVSMDLTFVPPHPFLQNMPESHSIKAESVTDAYGKIVKFLNRFGIVFRNP